MELIYRSTRNAQETATASMAILKGLANEGGLFVPDTIPALDKSLEELSKMDYREVAYQVMKLMFTDFTEDELKHCINSAYDSKFDTPVIAPLVKKAVERGHIIKRGNYYYLKDGNLPLCGVNEEPTFSVACRFLNLPKSSEMLLSLQAKTKD